MLVVSIFSNLSGTGRLFKVNKIDPFVGIFFQLDYNNRLKPCKTYRRIPSITLAKLVYLQGPGPGANIYLHKIFEIRKSVLN